MLLLWVRNEMNCVMNVLMMMLIMMCGCVMMSCGGC